MTETYATWVDTLDDRQRAIYDAVHLHMRDTAGFASETWPDTAHAKLFAKWDHLMTHPGCDTDDLLCAIMTHIPPHAVQWYLHSVLPEFIDGYLTDAGFTTADDPDMPWWPFVRDVLDHLADECRTAYEHAVIDEKSALTWQHIYAAFSPDRLDAAQSWPRAVRFEHDEDDDYVIFVLDDIDRAKVTRTWLTDPDDLRPPVIFNIPDNLGELDDDG